MKTLLDFVLDEPLGQGSSAIVHRARRLPSGETVALKCPLEDSAATSRALEREATMLGRVRHPNVARLVELVRMSDTDQPLGLAIELIDGPTLAEAGPLDTHRLAQTGADIARGLEALHDVGVIHGDIKPANIVFRPSGQAVLIDLDAAVDLTEDQADGTVVRATARFAAPETREFGERSTASDVWSLVASLRHCGDAIDASAPTGDAAAVDLLDLFESSLAADPTKRPTLATLIDDLDRIATRTRPTPAPSSTALDGRTSAPGGQAPAEEAGSNDDGDPTLVWRPVRPRRPAVPLLPPSRRPRSAAQLAPVRIGTTIVGVLLGIVGAFALIGGASNARQGPRPSLATPAALGPDQADVAVTSNGASTDEPSSAAPAAPETTTSTPASPIPCPPNSTDDDQQADQQAGIVRLDADLLAEGCTRSVSWDPATAEATVDWPDGPRRYAFGRAGDQLVLGDWDADGQATPALYRPSTGDTFTFTGWAEPDAPLPSATVEATGIRDGRAVVRTAIPGTAEHLIVEQPTVEQPTGTEAGP